MEPEDFTGLADINHTNLTHEQSAPIYGVIAHYYLGSKYSPSMTFTLQALATIEATAPVSEDGRGFFVSISDIVQHTNLDASTVARVLTDLEAAGALTRKRHAFKPSTFWITWENTLLGEEGASYLHAAQNAIWDH